MSPDPATIARGCVGASGGPTAGTAAHQFATLSGYWYFDGYPPTAPGSAPPDYTWATLDPDTPWVAGAAYSGDLYATLNLEEEWYYINAAQSARYGGAATQALDSAGLLMILVDHAAWVAATQAARDSALATPTSAPGYKATATLTGAAWQTNPIAEAVYSPAHMVGHFAGLALPAGPYTVIVRARNVAARVSGGQQEETGTDGDYTGVLADGPLPSSAASGCVGPSTPRPSTFGNGVGYSVHYPGNTDGSAPAPGRLQQPDIAQRGPVHLHVGPAGYTGPVGFTFVWAQRWKTPEVVPPPTGFPWDGSSPTDWVGPEHAPQLFLVNKASWDAATPGQRAASATGAPAQPFMYAERETDTSDGYFHPAGEPAGSYYMAGNPSQVGVELALSATWYFKATAAVYGPGPPPSVHLYPGDYVVVAKWLLPFISVPVSGPEQTPAVYGSLSGDFVLPNA